MTTVPNGAIPPCRACSPGCEARHDQHRDAGDPRGPGCWRCSCAGFDPVPTADPDRPCEHPHFSADVAVNRLTADGGGPILAFMAELTIACSACGEPFRFIGVPAGVMPDRPACSVDEATLHVPIRPASADPDYGLGIPGFAVTYHEGERPS